MTLRGDLHRRADCCPAQLCYAQKHQALKIMRRAIVLRLLIASLLFTPALVDSIHAQEVVLAGHGSYFIGISSTMPRKGTPAVVGASKGDDYPVNTLTPTSARVLLPIVGNQ